MLNIFHFIGLLDSTFKFVFYIQVCILFKFVFYIRVFILFECSHFAFKFVFYSRLYSIQSQSNSKYGGDLVKGKSTTRSTPNLAEVTRLHYCTDNVVHSVEYILHVTLYVLHSHRITAILAPAKPACYWIAVG